MSSPGGRVGRDRVLWAARTSNEIAKVGSRDPGVNKMGCATAASRGEISYAEMGEDLTEKGPGGP